MNVIGETVSGRMVVGGGGLELDRLKSRLGPTAVVQYLPIDPRMGGLYQDAAGTVPARNPGDPVRLVLDHGQGMRLGPERVVNGDFADGLTGWFSASNGVLAVVDGKLHITTIAPDNWGVACQPLSFAAPGTYRITALVEKPSTADHEIIIGVGSTSSGNRELVSRNVMYSSASASIEVLFTVPSAGTWYLQIGAGNFMSTGTAPQVATHSVSIREVLGRHYTAPSDTARPILGREPKTGRRNLHPKSYHSDAFPWWYPGSPSNGITATVVARGRENGIGYTDYLLNGTLTAGWSVPWYSGTETRPLNPGEQFTSSAHWSLVSGTWPPGVAVYNGGKFYDQAGWPVVGANDGSGIAPVTGSLRRHSYVSPAAPTGTAKAGLTLAILGAVGTALNNVVVRVGGLMFEYGNTLTPYQETQGLYDATEDGVPDVWYLDANGTNSALVAPAAPWGSDEVTVVAAVEVRAETGTGVIVEASPDYRYSDGTFVLSAPTGASKIVAARSRGTDIGGFPGTPIASRVPILTGMKAIISRDYTTLYLGGEAQVTMTNDQGSGEYGNHALYLGARGGTTEFFNGKIYSLLLINRSLPDAQRAAAERLVESRAPL